MARRLSDLTSPEAVQAALDEYARRGQAEFLDIHGFGLARDHVVLNPKTGEWADSKAIAGVAYGYQFPESGPFRASEFSGGLATVVARLMALGFEVRSVDAIRGTDWSAHEVALIVADYLAMLTSELTGQAYNKAARRRLLLDRLPGRSESSIEFKHANISAVMIELGFPYLRGYKPRSNFQRGVLVNEVAAQVSRNALIDDVTLDAVQRPAANAEVLDFSRVKTDAPKREVAVREPAAAYARAPIKRDYLEREARNRSLGVAGEHFALQFERWRLFQLGVPQLAEHVVHVAEQEGDGLGYDIRSFESDGNERFIEVKTTSFGERTPFFVSANEVRFSKDRASQFHLYRLFDFRAAPRLFQLDGPIELHCNLDATTFRASFG